MDIRGSKCQFLLCEIAPSLGVGTVHVCRPERFIGERSQFRAAWRRVGFPFLEDPNSQGRPFPVFTLQRARYPPASNSSPGCIFQSPNLGAGSGRWEVGGSTAWRLPQRLFPLGSLAPPDAGLPSNSAKGSWIDGSPKRGGAEAPGP